MTELINRKITQDTGTSSHIRVGKFGKGRDPPNLRMLPILPGGEGERPDRSIAEALLSR